MYWIVKGLVYALALGAFSSVAQSTCTDIRKIDFRNHAFPLKSADFTDGETKLLTVSKGKYANPSSPTDLAFLSFEIARIVYGDLNGDGKLEAAVVASYGSNSGNFFITDTYLFGCAKGKLKLIDVLKQDRMEKETGLRFDLFESYAKNPIWIRRHLLYIKYGTGGNNASPQFSTTFRYRLVHGKLRLFKQPLKVRNL